jgi:hypothetical protein
MQEHTNAIFPTRRYIFAVRSLLRTRSPSEVVAVAGSVIVAALFLAAVLGLGMNGMHKLGRLRLTPATVGLSLLPFPAVGWVLVMWSRPMPSRGARALRFLGTVLLLLAAAICAALTLFVLLVQPTPRAS